MTCLATLNCVIRSDFNFVFGLLGYYMIKTTNIKKMQRTAQTLLLVTGVILVMDVIWVLAMRSVWGSKPFNNHTTYAVFDYLRTFVLLVSYINIIVKIFILFNLNKLRSY